MIFLIQTVLKILERSQRYQKTLKEMHCRINENIISKFVIRGLKISLISNTFMQEERIQDVGEKIIELLGRKQTQNLLPVLAG